MTSWVNPANLLWSGQAGGSEKPCGLRGACHPVSVGSLWVLPGTTGGLGGPLGPLLRGLGCPRLAAPFVAPPYAFDVPLDGRL